MSKKIEEIIKDSSMYSVFVSEYPLHGGLAINKLIEAIEQYVIKARIESLEELKFDPAVCGKNSKEIFDAFNERIDLRIAELEKEKK